MHLLAARLLLVLLAPLLTAPAPQDAAAPLPLAPGAQDVASPDDPGAPLRVVATVPTYGELAREIGGELVDVVVLTRPGQDMHNVAATPSIMARVRGAELVLHTGLDAEPWLAPMVRSAGAGKLVGDPDRWLSLSDGIPLKNVPPQVSRRFGDLHAFGNTHVWTDPFLVRGMAERVRDALVAALPEHAEALRERHRLFHDRLTRALVRWLTDYQALQGREVVVYHTSWIYLLDRFGLVRAGTIEPKPRVVPTASHLEELVETMRARHVTLVLREPFHHPEATDFVAERTGATVLELSTHPGFPPEASGILEHFEHNLAAIATALGVPVSQEGSSRH